MLSIERKKQLSNIIQQAEANNESEENIKTLVSGFTKKYDNENATIEKTNPQKWGDVLSGKMSDKINPAPQENMVYGMYDQSGNIRGLEGDIGLGTVKAAIRTPIEGLKFSLTPEINLVSNIQNLYKSLTAPKTEGGKLTINKGKTPGTFEVGRTPITSGGYKPVEDTMNKLSALLEKTPLGYKTQKELDEAFLHNTALQMGAPSIQKAYNDFKAAGKYNMYLKKLNRAAENYLMKKNAINIGNVGEETVSPAIPKTWKEMTPADIALQKQTETILKNNNRSINNIATNIVLNKTRGTKITDAEVKTNIDKTKDSLNLTLPDLTKEQIDGILASDEPVKDLTLIYNNNKNAINEGYRELINWGDSMGARIDGDSIVKTAIQSPGYQKINKQIQYGINEGSVSIDKYGNFTTTNPKYLDYVDAMNEMNNELEKISGQLRMSYSDDYVLNGNERFRTAYRDNTKIPMLSDQKLFQKTIVDALRAEIRKVEDTLTNGQFTPMAQKRAAYMDLSDKLRVLSERATNQMAKQEAKKMTPSIKSILGKLGIEPTDFIAFNLKRAVIKSGINVASNLASQQSEINKAIKNSLKRWTVKEPIENPKPPIRLKLPEKQTYTPSVIIPENKNIILEDDEKLNPNTIVRTKQIPDGNVLEGTLSEKDLNDIIDEINKNGGITYNLKGKENLSGKKYYSVSIYPERSLITDKLDRNALADYIEQNIDLLSKADHQLGGWYDKESGKLYLDVAIAIKDRTKAIDLGKKYNQKAIFDLNKLEEIPTGGTGENIGDFGDINSRYTPEEIPSQLKLQEKIFYHGTDISNIENINKNGFIPTESIRSMGGIMEYPVKSDVFFFTDDKNVAKNWGKNRSKNGRVGVISAKLNMNKPFDLTNKEFMEWEGIEILRDNLKINENILEQAGIDSKNLEIKNMGNLSNLLDDPNIVKGLKELGYDSAIVPEGGGEYGDKSYAVFSRDQIKIES